MFTNDMIKELAILGLKAKIEKAKKVQSENADAYEKLLDGKKITSWSGDNVTIEEVADHLEHSTEFLEFLNDRLDQLKAFNFEIKEVSANE